MKNLINLTLFITRTVLGILSMAIEFPFKLIAMIFMAVVFIVFILLYPWARNWENNRFWDIMNSLSDPLNWVLLNIINRNYKM